MTIRWFYFPVLVLALASCEPLSPAISNKADQVTSAASEPEPQVTLVTSDVIAQLQNELLPPAPFVPPIASPADNSYQYLLGVGDVLRVRFYLTTVEEFHEDRQAVTDSLFEGQQTIIKDDGSASFPYIGEVKLAGKTLTDAKQSLDILMKKYFKNPQISLEVKEFRSSKVQLTGQLKKTGEQYLGISPLHVLEAIEQAGGVQEDADLANATVVHKTGAVQKIDLFSLINRGDASQNIILTDGDTLNVPVNSGNKVFVMGEVKQPSSLFIKGGRMNLAEALNASHGLETDSASYQKIYVIRGIPPVANTSPAILPTVAQTVAKSEAMQTVIYQLDGSSGTGLAMAAQFPLKPNDVIYVSPTVISKWSKVISQILPSRGATVTATHAW